MAASKVNINEIPSNILGDIQALVALPKKEYVAVGSSVYVIEPSPAIVLMEAMGMLTELLEKLRTKKIEVVQIEAPDVQRHQVQLMIRDIINSVDSGPSLHKILEKLLHGVDKADLDAMNVGQMIVAIDKAIKINMDTLPESFRETLPTLPSNQEVEEAVVEDEEIKNP